MRGVGEFFVKRPSGGLHLTARLVSMESAQISVSPTQMPKSETSNPNDGPSFSAPRYRPNWVVALVCLVLGVYLAVAFIACDPAQSRFITKPEPTLKNPAGAIGADAAYVMLCSVGVGTWLAPLFLLWSCYIALRSSKHLTSGRTIAMILACVTLASLASMFDALNWGSDPMKWSSNYFPKGLGGFVGTWLYHDALQSALGGFGSGLLFGSVYLGTILFIFFRDIGTELEKMIHNFGAWRAERAEKKAALVAQRAKEKEAKAKQKTAVAAVTAAAASMPAAPVGPSG